jgi:16S rRNA C967 or C1407 C5-methylase (RsmB/RsmF family)
MYATCTYHLAEHETVVQGLMEQRPASLQPITLPLPHSPGLLQWEDYTYDAHMQHCWWLYPDQTGSVGFCVASMRA